MRTELVDEVRGLLAHAGFAVSEVFRQRPISFDFLARRDDRLFIVKVLTNVDSLSDDVAHEMRVLARFLGGAPLLIGLKASSGALEAGALYVRHNVPILAVEGLRDYLLGGTLPIAIAAPGGFCVRLDGGKLREMRETKGYSLGQLADVAGVSRRAISMYEAGMSATIEAAVRLEEHLGEPLIQPIDPFARAEPEAQATPETLRAIGDPFLREIFQMLSTMGLGIVPTKRSPFHAIGLTRPAAPEPSPRDALLISGSTDVDLLLRRARLLASVSRVSERTSVFIVPGRADVPAGAAVIRADELGEVGTPAELAKLVKEKKES